MLEQSDSPIDKIKAPYKQMVLDWIENANSTLNSKQVSLRNLF